MATETFNVAARGYEEVLGFTIEKHPNEASPDPYGTVIDPVTSFLRVLQCTLDPSDIPTTRPSSSGSPTLHYHGTAAAPTPTEIQLLPDVRGTIEWELDEALTPFLLGSAMHVHGDSNYIPTPLLYSRAGGALPVPIIHTMRVPTVASAPGHNITIMRETSRLNTKFGGCQFESFSINGESGSPLLCSADVVAQNYNVAEPSDTPAFTVWPNPAYLIHQCKIFFNTTVGTAAPLAATAITVRSFTLEIVNPLRIESATNVEDSSASASTGRGIRQPILEDAATYRLTARGDYDNDTLLALMRSTGTGGYMTVELFLLAGTDGGNSERSYRFRMPAAKLMGNFPTYGGGDGIIPYELVFEAALFTTVGGDDEVFECEIYNDQDLDYATIFAG